MNHRNRVPKLTKRNLKGLQVQCWVSPGKKTWKKIWFPPPLTPGSKNTMLSTCESWNNQSWKGLIWTLWALPKHLKQWIVKVDSKWGSVPFLKNKCLPTSFPGSWQPAIRNTCKLYTEYNLSDLVSLWKPLSGPWTSWNPEMTDWPEKDQPLVRSLPMFYSWKEAANLCLFGDFFKGKNPVSKEVLIWISWIFQISKNVCLLL